jgi:flavorubredoxin
MDATVTEIANDVFRIAIQPSPNLGFACFLVRDELPAMVETGFARQHGMFEAVRGAVEGLIDIEALRYIFVPHFEGDECGALNRFLEIAPKAEAVASPIGARLTLADWIVRPALAVGQGEKLSLGKKTLQTVITPWVHMWDSMLVYDETDRLLFTSDLFGQTGVREPMTTEDRVEEALAFSSGGALPSQAHLVRALDRIEPLAVDVLACHHGSVLQGDPSRYYRAFREHQVGDQVDAPSYERR